MFDIYDPDSNLDTLVKNYILENIEDLRGKEIDNYIFRWYSFSNNVQPDFKDTDKSLSFIMKYKSVGQSLGEAIAFYTGDYYFQNDINLNHISYPDDYATKIFDYVLWKTLKKTYFGEMCFTEYKIDSHSKTVITDDIIESIKEDLIFISISDDGNVSVSSDYISNKVHDMKVRRFKEILADWCISEYGNKIDDPQKYFDDSNCICIAYTEGGYAIEELEEDDRFMGEDEPYPIQIIYDAENELWMTYLDGYLFHISYVSIRDAIDLFADDCDFGCLVYEDFDNYSSKEIYDFICNADYNLDEPEMIEFVIAFNGLEDNYKCNSLHWVNPDLIRDRLVIDENGNYKQIDSSKDKSEEDYEEEMQLF